MPVSPLQTFVLGIVQGLTEFLPISSSAHLVLFPRFFGWVDPGLSFDVALHLGTLGGLLVYFWRDYWNLAKSLVDPSNEALKGDRRMVAFLIMATIPAAVAGFLLEEKAETVFRSPTLIAYTLIFGAIALALADRFSRGHRKVGDMTWTFALLIGVAQALAIVPGISRSGITITAALALGFDRREAARFSFLLSAPVIAGAGILKLKAILMTPDKLALMTGFIGAALAGYLAIWGLLKYVQTRNYTPFVIYRWILGAFILLTTW